MKQLYQGKKIKEIRPKVRAHPQQVEGVGEYSDHQVIGVCLFSLFLVKLQKLLGLCQCTTEKSVGGYGKTDSCPILILGLSGSTPCYSGCLICAIKKYSFQLLMTVPEH